MILISPMNLTEEQQREHENRAARMMAYIFRNCRPLDPSVPLETLDEAVLRFRLEKMSKAVEK